MREPAQDALNRIGVLQQGSKSITDYCTAFFKLKGKLSPRDAASDYVQDRFWKGLSAASMEALVHAEWETAEQARDFLLRKENRLADLAARRKGFWQATNTAAPRAQAAASTAPASNTTAHAAPPPPPADPNAMDVDRAKASLAARKCFKCNQTGHLMAACPQWAATIKAAVTEAFEANQAKVEGAPKAGFV
ncbi:hypothetical protein C0992_011376 [Termitomyces sp. T32_za158]|nr:hypothetical protein C0992_011376 [Termitomyces sp. T32_za158]